MAQHKNSEKKFIGLVQGSIMVNFNCSSYGNIQKIDPAAKPRAEIAKLLFAKIEETLSKEADKRFEIVSYLNSGYNSHFFRKFSNYSATMELKQLKKDLINGDIDVVNLKADKYLPITYIIVPVDGDCE